MNTNTTEISDEPSKLQQQNIGHRMRRIGGQTGADIGVH